MLCLRERSARPSPIFKQLCLHHKCMDPCLPASLSERLAARAPRRRPQSLLRAWGFTRVRVSAGLGEAAHTNWQ